MWLKYFALVLVVAILFSGCSYVSSEETERKMVATICYENYQTFLRECAVEALGILDDYNLSGTRLYASDQDKVYIEAVGVEISSKKLSEALNQVVRGINVVDKGVTFFLNTGGFASNSNYSGLFYSPTDDIYSVPYLIPDLQYVYEDGIIKGEKSGSDNSVYIEHIDDGFFYFYLTF